MMCMKKMGGENNGCLLVWINVSFWEGLFDKTVKKTISNMKYVKYWKIA